MDKFEMLMEIISDKFNNEGNRAITYKSLMDMMKCVAKKNVKRNKKNPLKIVQHVR